jgi:formylglycine-generating enzyme required for sulfatase activity
MLKRIVLITLSAALCVSGLFAEPADLVFAALKAKNDKEVTRLLQDLALARDYPQMDKIQEKNPELFDAKHFPGDFLGKVIFNYVENAAAKAKAAQKASGSTNPHPKNTWQWYLWDLDKALSTRAATKDAALQKTLNAQISKDISILKSAMTDYLEADAKLAIGMYLYALDMGAIPGGSGSGDDVAEQLNAQFAEEANAILEYLFKAGVPFPVTLPAALKLDAWKRLKASYDSFIKITMPEKQSEYETKAEFEARNAEAKRLDAVIRSIELTLPAELVLGDYNVEGGYFRLGINLPALDQFHEGRLIDPIAWVIGLGQADLRYYIIRKNAPFFKDKGFSSWLATATITAQTPGIYRLKELAVKNGKEPVSEGLWGFSVKLTPGSHSETIIRIENYIKGREFNFSGTKVSGFEQMIPILADGQYSLSASSGELGQFWTADLKALWIPVVGGLGPAGGIVFYDKGNDSEGWRYLEMAPCDQGYKIGWGNSDDDKGVNIATGTTIGTGRANTESIILAQVAGNYAALACKTLNINGFTDWFLPSGDELGIMYDYLKRVGLLYEFGRKDPSHDRYYWTSSSVADSYEQAYGLNVSQGSYESLQRNYRCSVRAIRQFSQVKDTPLTSSTPAVVPEKESKPEVSVSPAEQPAATQAKDPAPVAKESAQPVVKETKQAIAKGFVAVTGGSFRMGSPAAEKGREKHEGPQHQVSLSDYWIGMHEVTVAEFGEFVGSSRYKTTAEKEGSGVDMKNPAKLTPGMTWQDPMIVQNKTDPVVMVSWYDAVEYCNWRSKKEGLRPAYSVAGSTVAMIEAANGYRLPTEAEWEYAARGGVQWALQPYLYAGSDNLEEVGWFGKNSAGSTHPVGSKKANALGLFDMSGNAGEWCWDFYSKDYYAKASGENPLGPPTGTTHVYRGGYWFWDTEKFERVAYRAYAVNALFRSNAIGFRLVRKP